MINRFELHYRNTVSAIAACMLSFLLLSGLFGIALIPLELLTSVLFPFNTVGGEIFYQLCFSLGYFITFAIPAFVLRFALHKKGHQHLPCHASTAISWRFLLVLPAGVMLIMTASHLNAQFVQLFGGTGALSEPMVGGTGRIRPHSIVLQFILMAVVPGFCEELLFRGAILTNCLPFGRSKAIFISALLFALMHQNPAQIFYTFVAGIVLGLVYERTHSLLACSALHVFNNLTALIKSVLFDRFLDAVTASIAVIVFELFFFAIGSICLGVLLIQEVKKQKDAMCDGVFGRSLPAADDYASEPIEAGAAYRLFLTPGMIAFLVLCILQTVVIQVVI